MAAQKKIQNKKAIVEKKKLNILEEVIMKEFPRKRFSFEELSNRISLQYDKLKNELFLLLAENAEVAKDKKLELIFDKQNKEMRFQVKKS